MMRATCTAALILTSIACFTLSQLHLKVIFSQSGLVREKAVRLPEARIALLVGGSVRSLTAPVVHQSLKHAIEGLRSKTGMNVSLVLALSFSDRSSWGKPSLFPQWTEEDLLPALKVLKPEHMVYYNNSENPNYRHNSSDALGRNCTSGANFQLVEASVAHFDCSKLMLEEAEHLAEAEGYVFKWFVRTRPDVVWLHSFPLELQALHRPHNLILYDATWPWYMHDMIYVVHTSIARELWGKGSSILSEIQCDETRAGDLVNPEALLALVIETVVKGNTTQMNLPKPVTKVNWEGIDCSGIFMAEGSKESDMCLAMNTEYEKQKESLDHN